MADQVVIPTEAVSEPEPNTSPVRMVFEQKDGNVRVEYDPSATSHEMLFGDAWGVDRIARHLETDADRSIQPRIARERLTLIVSKDSVNMTSSELAVSLAKLLSPQGLGLAVAHATIIDHPSITAYTLARITRVDGRYMNRPGTLDRVAQWDKDDDAFVLHLSVVDPGLIIASLTEACKHFQLVLVKKVDFRKATPLDYELGRGVPA